MTPKQTLQIGLTGILIQMSELDVANEYTTDPKSKGKGKSKSGESKSREADYATEQAYQTCKSISSSRANGFSLLQYRSLMLNLNCYRWTTGILTSRV